MPNMSNVAALMRRVRKTPKAAAPPPSGAPAWLGSTAVNQWVEISGSTMTGVGGTMSAPFGNTGPSSRVEAWSSYALKGKVAWCVAQGGHGDYWGNEVLSIDFGANSPAWTVVKASVSNAQPNADSSRYADGSPSAVHGYNTIQYDPIGDRIVRVGSGAYAKAGSSNGDCAVYDIASNTYLSSGTIPNMRTPGAAKWAAWCDPATGNLYCFFNFDVDRYNKSGNNWSATVASSGVQYGYEAIACTDTTRGRAFICGGDPAARQPVTFTFATNALASVTMSGAAASAVNDSQFGLQFCPTTDKYYLKNGSSSGGGMVEIDASTFAATNMSTTSGSGIPAAVDAINSQYNGVFSRLLYVDLGGGVGGLAYLPTYASNWWFLRLH
jgi:hypothetical protein